MEAAKGGAVLGRTRDFLKETDEFRNPEEGKRQSRDVVGDTADEDQKYAKSGPGKGSGFGPKLKEVCCGDSKSLKPIKPRT
jgi:hypothetical protein